MKTLLLLAAGTLLAAACAKPSGTAEPALAGERRFMVESQLVARDIVDERVIAAMRKVPRHEFVPAELRSRAYDDNPLPIGEGQTISQPYVVACMTQAARLKGGERVLEVGTGSGYQAAVLAEVAGEVWSIEIVEPLAQRAKATLERLGVKNVHLRTGDGYRGWPEEAPFDAILVTAAPEQVPQPLIDQLAPGGRLVIPVGARDQELLVIERTPDGIAQRSLFPVRFVPMTGEAQRR